MQRSGPSNTENTPYHQGSEKYDPDRVHKIAITPQTEMLLSQATKVYADNFDGKTWYGRCIFLSWYCSLADCKFCFRATKSRKFIDQNAKKQTPQEALRSKASVAIEALLCRQFGWRIEFLTGGYGMMPFSDLVAFAKLVSQVYGEKIWLNVGVLAPKQIEQLEPYVKGICASIETCSPQLHNAVCPNKPIEPYQKMFNILKEKFPHMKRSIAIIIGMSGQMGIPEYDEDLYRFIEQNELDRITAYALKPVRGTPFTIPPSTDEYVTALAKLRIRFPKLQIIAGTNLRRCHEAGLLMQAGANAITKFPATKQFATQRAHNVTRLITEQQREFTSNLTKMQQIDWNTIIDTLQIDKQIKAEMKQRLPAYLHRFEHPVDKEADKVEGASPCFDE